MVRSGSVKREIVIADDGRPMRVVRPRDPALALAIAKVAVAHPTETRIFDELPAQQPYTMLGFLGRSKKEPRKFCIVDALGGYVGELQPGDSFVTTDGTDPRPGDSFTPGGQ